MDDDQMSALTYAERNGLFYSHRHDAFSPQACLARLQSSLDVSSKDLFDHGSLQCNIDLTESSINFDVEHLVDGLSKEVETSTETTWPFARDRIHDLLVELPEIETSTNDDNTSSVTTLGSTTCLSAQFLPLISVDRKRDEGLDFPLHMDRLHHALAYKVDYEQLASSTAVQALLEDGINTDLELFAVHEDAITPPQSPRHEQVDLSYSPKLSPHNREDPLRQLAESRPIPEAYSIVRKESSSCLAPRPATSLKATPDNELKDLESFAAGQPRENDRIRFSEVESQKSPIHSFFEDAFFADEEQNAEIQSKTSKIDQINNLLMPLPTLHDPEISSIGTRISPGSDMQSWEHHKKLPTLPIDTNLEEALLWAPLPAQRVRCFEEDGLIEPKKQNALSSKKMSNHNLMGILDSMKDDEIEESAGTTSTLKVKQLPKNSLDALVKLKLQRSMSEQVLSASASTRSPRFRTNKTILPAVDDPGATSKLVSAFMALRGAKKPRTALK
ncbi:hypothetical protein PWT90_06551 [Aphanocladium album]|nr:hypothetical protein PWT90_06551 [Aphanocladium album]